MIVNDFDSFVEDFLGEKIGRSLMIVAASKIDVLLFAILSKYLLPKISGNNDDLLEGDQPIGTFSSRIKLTYRLGIIDRGLYDSLEQVRKIRNLSAHRIEFNIKRSPVRDHISGLKQQVFARRSFDLVKQRYFNGEVDSSLKEMQCVFITLCVVLQAVLEKVGSVEINEELERISGK